MSRLLSPHQATAFCRELIDTEKPLRQFLDSDGWLFLIRHGSLLQTWKPHRLFREDRVYFY
jgi:hypothetical protein